MAPPRDKDKDGKAPREEFEVAYYTKELGRKLQRKMLQRQFDDFSDSTITAAQHGEDLSVEPQRAPPREDRAG